MTVFGAYGARIYSWPKGNPRALIAWECSRTWDIGDPFRECLWFLVVGPKGVDGRCRLSGVFGSWRIDGLVATRRRRGAGYALPVGDFGVGR